MTKRPVRLAERVPRKAEENAVEVMAPAAGGNPFLSFRYSYTEISTLGGKAHVKSRKARFEDGKLTAEAFEGDLDQGAYEQMVAQAQQYVQGQTALWLNALALLLPFSQKQRPDRS